MKRVLKRSPRKKMPKSILVIGPNQDHVWLYGSNMQSLLCGLREMPESGTKRETGVSTRITRPYSAIYRVNGDWVLKAYRTIDEATKHGQHVVSTGKTDLVYIARVISEIRPKL